MMNEFICPVCGEELTDNGKTYTCSGGHCYDKSKFGYVNLLMSNQSSAKRHGDDRAMVRARRDFLSAGYYSFLMERINGVCREYLPEDARILDAGCGECYYSGSIASLNGKYSFTGIDISKDALEFAHKRGVTFPLAVASLFSLPLADESRDCIINCFSPFACDEFRRVLKKGGILISVVPLEEHLFSLKSAIYETPYYNEKPDTSAEGFEKADFIEIRKELNPDNPGDIRNLFMMTPYYYKTGREDQKKLDEIKCFSTVAAFGIYVFRKK